MDFLQKLKDKTRWDYIPNENSAYRLSCSHPVCSLSCANLRNGRLSTTSIHGEERHSYVFTKNDMAFSALEFLNSLSEKDLSTFCKMFSKLSPEYILNLEKLQVK